MTRFYLIALPKRLEARSFQRLKKVIYEVNNESYIFVLRIGFFFDDRFCLILVFLDQKTKMLDRVKWLLQKIQEPHP